MIVSHFFNTFRAPFELAQAGLDPHGCRSAWSAHLIDMAAESTAHDLLLEPVLSLAELADYLCVPVQTLYDLRAKGRGPRGFRVGRCLLFRKSEVEAWLADLESEDGDRSLR